VAIAVLGLSRSTNNGTDPWDRRRESVGRPPIVMQVDLEGGRQNQQIQVDMTKEMMKERTTAQDIKRMDSGTF